MASQIRSSPSALKGIVVDDLQAHHSSAWKSSRAIHPFHELGYQHDGNSGNGRYWAQFKTALSPGVHEVRMTYTANPNRATNVPVEIHHRFGIARIKVNQQETPAIDGFASSLGSYEFNESGMVVIDNEGTDGHVIIDAVQWIKK